MLSTERLPYGGLEDFIRSSERIRQKLENKLKQVFLDRKSLFYKHLYECRTPVGLTESQIIQFVSPMTFDKARHDRLKMAVNTWGSMYPDDRKSVIQYFLFLFFECMTEYDTAQKNMTFCYIFIEEFTDILSEPI